MGNILANPATKIASQNAVLPAVGEAVLNANTINGKLLCSLLEEVSNFAIFHSIV